LCLNAIGSSKIAGKGGFRKMKAKLKVINTNLQKTAGYLLIQGHVANDSEQALNNIVAVAEYWSDKGVLLKKSDILVDVTSIKPQNASTFCIITLQSPDIEYVHLSFKYLLGENIETSGCTTFDKNGRPGTGMAYPVKQLRKPDSLLKRLKMVCAERYGGYLDRK
jgi:hypothetical protein